MRGLGAAAFLCLSACHRPAPPPVPVPHADIPNPCVSFRDLEPALPPAPFGFSRVEDEGSNGKYGETLVSEAKRTFFGPDGGQVAVRIVDTTASVELGAAIRAATEDARVRPDSDPTAPLFLDGGVGFVRYDRGADDPRDTRAEVTLYAAGFVVAVTSQGVAGTDLVRAVARGLNLAALSNLRQDARRRVP